MTTEIQNFDTGDSVAPSPRWLLLMRHAKSDWGDHSLSDFDRPLNRRGLMDSPAMGRWLNENDALPDLVLSSSAVRTRETIRDMMAIWKEKPVVSFRESLYLASPDTILQTIHSASDERSRLMILAHNPGISQLVSTLAQQSIEMPTAAVAVFRVSIGSWNELTSKSNVELVHFMRPKAL